jgi:AcrR family transcriptional regulator
MAGSAKGHQTEPSATTDEPLVGDHPLAKLPAVAREMVAAATRVILRDGYSGLTLRSAAVEANVYADAIRYYFGGKKGLVEAVALSLSHDLTVMTLESVSDVDDEAERLRAMAQINHTIAEDLDDYRVYWELLPHILADPEWKVREAEDYEWYRRLYARLSPRRPAGFDALPDPERARDLASLLMAVGDGLALQKLLDPEHVDLSAIFALWDEIVTPVLEETFGATDDPAS